MLSISPLYLTVVILIEFLLNQLFLEFTPRLDIIFITIFSNLNPFTLFILGIMKDMVNTQIMGLTSLLYLLLFILHYYYRLKKSLSIIFILCAEWAIGMVFLEDQQLVRGLIANLSATLAVYFLFNATFLNIYLQR